jgi:hypothetical protein
MNVVVLRENKGKKVPQVRQDQPDLLEPLARLVQEEVKVQPVWELRVQQGVQGWEGLKGHRVHRVYKDQQVHKERKDQLVHKERKDHLVHKERKDRKKPIHIRIILLQVN